MESNSSQIRQETCKSYTFIKIDQVIQRIFVKDKEYNGTHCRNGLRDDNCIVSTRREMTPEKPKVIQRIFGKVCRITSHG